MSAKKLWDVLKEPYPAGTSENWFSISENFLILWPKIATSRNLSWGGKIRGDFKMSILQYYLLYLETEFCLNVQIKGIQLNELGYLLEHEMLIKPHVLKELFMTQKCNAI